MARTRKTKGKTTGGKKARIPADLPLITQRRQPRRIRSRRPRGIPADLPLFSSERFIQRRLIRQPRRIPTQRQLLGRRSGKKRRVRPAAFEDLRERLELGFDPTTGFVRPTKRRRITGRRVIKALPKRPRKLKVKRERGRPIKNPAQNLQRRFAKKARRVDPTIPKVSLSVVKAALNDGVITRHQPGVRGSLAKQDRELFELMQNVKPFVTACRRKTALLRDYDGALELMGFRMGQ
jgi:hypothetical protein